MQFVQKCRTSTERTLFRKATGKGVALCLVDWIFVCLRVCERRTPFLVVVLLCCYVDSRSAVKVVVRIIQYCIMFIYSSCNKNIVLITNTNHYVWNIDTSLSPHSSIVIAFYRVIFCKQYCVGIQKKTKLKNYYFSYFYTILLYAKKFSRILI